MSHLVVDMARVLRETEHGKTAKTSLMRLLERTKAQEDALRAKWEKSSGSAKKQAREKYVEFQKKARGELDRRRDALQSALVGLATTAAKAIAEERGIDLVLERSSVLVFSEAADVTEEVIARVNAVKLGGS
jgi:Skp family chaperone for outer membrane proteins